MLPKKLLSEPVNKHFHIELDSYATRSMQICTRNVTLTIIQSLEFLDSKISFAGFLLPKYGTYPPCEGFSWGLGT